MTMHDNDRPRTDYNRTTDPNYDRGRYNNTVPMVLGAIVAGLAILGLVMYTTAENQQAGVMDSTTRTGSIQSPSTAPSTDPRPAPSSPAPAAPQTTPDRPAAPAQ